jgi:hypothetical protein
MINDYIVRDSTLFKNGDEYDAYDKSDGAIRIGIVRSFEENEIEGTKYLVEVWMAGQQVPVSCVAATRFNSPYNFEEIRLKHWLRGPAAPGFLPEGTAGKYSFRDGTVVVVGFLDGSSREGVILGCIKHPNRAVATETETFAYHSVYNGLETTIDPEGAYTVTFQGAPLNDAVPVPPGTAEPSEVQYDPTKAGSMYGFDATGSFFIDCSNEIGDNKIEITRDPGGGTMTITSGQNVISIAGNPAQGELTVTTGNLTLETFATKITAQTEFALEATTAVKIKGLQVAIGNDTVELLDALLQILDGIGQVTVTSPVGTCTPLMASPQWPSSVLPLIIQLQTLKGSL